MNLFSMDSSSCVVSKSASEFVISLTMCTGRSAGGVDDGWLRLASVAFLFRDGVPLPLGAVVAVEEVLLPQHSERGA